MGKPSGGSVGRACGASGQPPRGWRTQPLNPRGWTPSGGWVWTKRGPQPSYPCSGWGGWEFLDGGRSGGAGLGREKKEMKTNREIDAQIAEHCMGFKECAGHWLDNRGGAGIETWSSSGPPPTPQPRSNCGTRCGRMGGNWWPSRAIHILRSFLASSMKHGAACERIAQPPTPKRWP